jgi:hypothetical protein
MLHSDHSYLKKFLRIKEKEEESEFPITKITSGTTMLTTMATEEQVNTEITEIKETDLT